MPTFIIVLKAFKYRLYPTLSQAAQIDQSIGVCRLVYNLALEVKTWAYRNGVGLSAIDLCYQLVELRKEYNWIQQVDSQALQAAVKKVDVAFRNFFNGSGYPRFKSKRNEGSFQCPNNTRKIDWDQGTLSIPKIKDIPIVLSQRFEGRIKTVTISRTSTGKYYASILVETRELFPVAVRGYALGIDLGIAHFAVLSTGEKISNPRFLSQNIVRLKVLQRRTSRKQKGSNNRKKACRKVAVIHEKIKNQRIDFLHKFSSRLTRDNQTGTIYLESLRVRNMLKNHSLARSISEVGWSQFVNMLEYKSKWYGRKVVKIDSWYPSSKTCSCCGHVVEDMDLSMREWTCGRCGTHHDRDVNAARNIRAIGIKTGVGSSDEPVESWPVGRAGKQETIQR